MSYLHDQKNIIYRSVKPENICIGEDGHIALGDFDFCKILTGENDRTYTFVGTPEYLSPEQIKNDPYNRMVDWWGLGVVVYELLVGFTPFYTPSPQAMFSNIRSKEIVFPNERHA